MNVAYLCERGLQRVENEDSILVDELESLFIVADGMGGHSKGCIASTTVVDIFRKTTAFLEEEKLESFDEQGVKKALEKQLNLQVEKVTGLLYAYASKNIIEGTIGSTVVGLYKLPIFEKWAVFHLGDSRVYHLSNNTLTQLTLDHLDSTTSNSILSKAIGNFEAIPLELNFFNSEESDLFLLCSDGISDYCSNDELLNLLMKYRYSLALCCQYIKELIYGRGAKDNLSLIVVRIGKE
jgi:protein phosphatase